MRVFGPADMCKGKASAFVKTPCKVIFKPNVQAMFLKVLTRIFGER